MTRGSLEKDMLFTLSKFRELTAAMNAANAALAAMADGLVPISRRAIESRTDVRCPECGAPPACAGGSEPGGGR